MIRALYQGSVHPWERVSEIHSSKEKLLRRHILNVKESVWPATDYY